MAALELLCRVIGINPSKLSKEENLILEADLFHRISSEIDEIYKTQHEDYFNLTSLNVEMENTIMELNIIRCLINDILKNEDYTLSGIAYYTQTPEELVHDLWFGYKISPVITFSRKLVELHKMTRPDFYKNILKKVALLTEDN